LSSATDNSLHMTITTTFFTAASSSHEFFAIPYAFAALLHNPDARVEICVENPVDFEGKNGAAFAVLRDTFGERALFRGGCFEGRTPNIVRFLEEPQIKTEFTYIGDIDILVLEHVSPRHRRMIADLGIPHSNIQRAGEERLSGLHFTRTDAYYPVQIPIGFDIGARGTATDERFLYGLAKARGELPPPEHRRRPAHGFHLSFKNRVPFARPGWGLNESMEPAYRAMVGSERWQALERHLDARFLAVKTLLDGALAARAAFGSPQLERIRMLSGKV
jgi:hypothetical protein